jgi:hypothetical protein
LSFSRAPFLLLFLSLDSFKCESLLLTRYYLLNLCNVSPSFSPRSYSGKHQGCIIEWIHGRR